MFCSALQHIGLTGADFDTVFAADWCIVHSLWTMNSLQVVISCLSAAACSSCVKFSHQVFFLW